jgi:hypothetical protein
VSGETVQPIFDLSSGTALYAAWNELELTLPHSCHGEWATGQLTIPDGVKIIKSDVREDQSYYLIPSWSDPAYGEEREHQGPAHAPDCWTMVNISRQSREVEVNTVASDPAVAQQLMERARELFPTSEPEDDAIRVKFWGLSQNGATQWNRELDAVTWDEISKNYPEATRDELDRLFADDFKPGHGGQLILWHGKPGTGKTTALRALAKRWESWAEVNYITDPDKFFGASSSYMLRVLLEEVDAPYVDEKQEAEAKGKWKLLVLEDASELFGATAKQDVGPALGRFLNVVDGLIGQGLRVVVLATTNEDDGNWNEAVARPGRTAAQVEFHGFDAESARGWRVDHGLPNAGSAAELADLYAELEGARTKPSSEPIGFASAS